MGGEGVPQGYSGAGLDLVGFLLEGGGNGYFDSSFRGSLIDSRES